MTRPLTDMEISSTPKPAPHPNVMIDLETMGTAPGSAIVSLGAVAFDPDGGTLGETFYRVISLASCQRAGLTIDAATVMWWLQRSDQARTDLMQAAEDLPTVLGWFAAWWRRQQAQFIWGHGANFDEPLLAAAFRAAHVVAPWKYWNARCTRTLFAIAGAQPDRQQGTHHNALDDATAQAEAVIRAYRRLAAGATR